MGLCLLCNNQNGKQINYGTGGANAFLRHAKSKVHQQAVATSKLPSLPTVMTAVNQLEAGVTSTGKNMIRIDSSLVPYGLSENVLSQLSKSTVVSSVSLEPEKVKPIVQALICSFISEHSLALSLAPKLVELSKELAKDPKALSAFNLSRKSASTKLVHGMHVLDHKRLISSMKTSPFSLNIDESTVKASRKKVLNIMVCFFDVEDQKPSTHLYGSIEMFLVNAQTVYNAVICKLQEDDIPLENLMTILSDSAAYMRGKANGFQAKMKENAQHVDIDGDLCHHIHNVVKMFAKNVDPDMHLSMLLDDIHNDFGYSADLRADLHEISEALALQPSCQWRE